MKKKVLSMILAASLGMTALAGCGSTAGTSEAQTDNTQSDESAEAAEASTSDTDAENQVVRIQVSKDTVCGVAMQVAAENGYFEEEFAEIGQSVEITVAASSETFDLITADKIDAAFGLACNFITPIANGLAVSFVTGVHKGCTKFYALETSGITSLEDLKGKTIGVPTLVDSSTLELKRKLADLGFVVNGADADVTFVAYSMPDLPTALDNGAVDVIGVHEPMGYNVESNYDVVKIMDTGEDEKFADEYCCMALVTQKMVSENPEGVVAFTKAVQRGAAFAQANPVEAAQIQVDGGYVAGDPAVNATIIEGLDFTPSVADGRVTFSNAFADLQGTGDIDASLDEAEFTEKVFPVIGGAPESCTYDTETQEFTFLY